MKIKEVINRTNLSKRTIYYYIEEGLITPAVDQRNGYNDFSENDINNLIIIKSLRQADFSINDIKSILMYPTSTHLYVEKQLEMLKSQSQLIKEMIHSLQSFNINLPINTSLNDILEGLLNVSFPEKNSIIHDSDKESISRLVSLFLWGSFLQDVDMSEYQEYLWNKIINITATSDNKNILKLKNYIYTLTAKEIDNEFNTRYIHINDILTINEHNIYDYVEKMKLSLIQFSKSEKLQMHWKKTYDTIILPLTNLYDSEVNELVIELSPKFSTYYNNIHSCCEKIYQWLFSDDGEPLRLNLLDNLDGYIDIESNHHGEIIAMSQLGSILFG